MQHIDVKTESGEYRISFVPELEDIPEIINAHINPDSVNFYITDTNVSGLYREFTGLLEEETKLKPLVIPAGENSKSYSVLKQVYDGLLSAGCDRKSTIVSLGGGVVGDLAGFAAGTVFRGIPCIQIPTTLLSQSDSSVGGKTAINHETGKNLIGVFHQPEAVIIHTGFLKTLPLQQYVSGLGEVIKSALIGDAELWKILVEYRSRLTPDAEKLNADIVRRSVQVKQRVVEQDEREKGLRMVLNYGHTIGHGIEKSLNSGITHGEAVLLGMYASNLIAMDKNLLPDTVFAQVDELLLHYISEMKVHKLDTAQVLSFMQSDKKWFASSRNFIILEDIAKVKIVKNIEPDLIETAIERITNLLLNNKENGS